MEITTTTICDAFNEADAAIKAVEAAMDELTNECEVTA